MRAEDIQQHLRNDPFLPLRVHVSDGNSYDIENRDYAFVWARQFIIGLDPSQGGVPRRSVYIDPVHITRIEPIVSGPASNGQR